MFDQKNKRLGKTAKEAHIAGECITHARTQWSMFGIIKVSSRAYKEWGELTLTLLKKTEDGKDWILPASVGFWPK